MYCIYINKNTIIISEGELSTGFECYDFNLLVISVSEIFSAPQKKRRLSSEFKQGETVIFSELKPGDYIVHKTNGIGEFIGVVQNVKKNFFSLNTNILNNGDGICFFNEKKELQGTNINRTEGNIVFPADIKGIKEGIKIYRNFNKDFDNKIKNANITRKLSTTIKVRETKQYYMFFLTDEEGNVKLDLEYLTEREHFDILMNSIEIILGTYEKLDDGSVVEVSGSKLVETLLPSIYAKYIKGLIPADFEELVEILNIENLPAEDLASDIRRLVYIAHELVAIDIQNVIVGKPIEYVASLESMYNVIDALLSIKMFGPCGNEVFAWVINYAAEKFAGQLNIEKVSADDFADVDWAAEGTTAKLLITKLVDFLKVNGLRNTEQLMEFIKNSEYLTTEFMTVENINDLMDVVSTLLDLQVVEVVIPVIFNAVVNQVASGENAVIKNFWNNELSGEELVEDLDSILVIADIIVNQTDFVQYWHEDFKCEIFFPEASLIVDVIDRLFALHLIQGYEAKILDAVLEKVLPESLPFTVKEINTSSVTDWTAEIDAFEEVITIAISALKDNGFESIQDLTETQFDQSKIFELIRDKNLAYVADILEALVGSTMVKNILPSVFNEYALKVADQAGYNVDFLNDLTSEELANDALVIASILDIADEVGIDAFFTETEGNNVYLEIKSVDKLLEGVQSILTETRKLNIVTKHEADLTALIANKVLELAKITDFTIDASTFDEVDWENSAKKIVEVIGIVRELAKSNNISNIKGFNDYLEKVKADINVAITNKNATYVAQILETIANADAIAALLPIAVEYGVDKACAAGIDLSFLDEAEFTSTEIANDIITLAYIVLDLVKVQAIDIYKGVKVSNIDLDALKDIPVQLNNLNILTKYGNEWTAFAVNYVLDLVKLEGFDARYEANDFASIEGNDWENDAQLLGSALANIVSALEELLPEGITIEGVKDLFSDINGLLDEEVLTDSVVNNLFSGISQLIDIEVVGVIVPDFMNYGLDKLAEKDIDLSFLENSTITNEQLASDISTLGKVVTSAIHAGALGFYHKENVTLDADALKEIPTYLSQVNLLAMYANDWTAFLVNYALDAVKIQGFDTRYEAKDFEHIESKYWVDDAELLGDALVDLANVLTELFPQGVTVEAINEFISDKGYLEKANLTDSVVSNLFNAVSKLVDTEVAGVIVADFVDFGVEKLNEAKFNVNFINGETFTNEELAADIKVLGDIVNNLVKAGLVEFINKEAATLDAVALGNIPSQLAQLNILAKVGNEWTAFVVNYVLDLIKLKGFDTRYEAKDFAHLNGDDWADDAELLGGALESLAAALTELFPQGITVEAINEFISSQGYLEKANLTDSVIENVFDAVSKLVDIEVIGVVIPDFVNYGVNQLFEGGIDISFLENIVLTNEELAADIKVLGNIVTSAVHFGAIELYKGEVVTLDSDALKEIPVYLSELNVLAKYSSHWMAFVVNKVLDLINIADFNTRYIDRDFANITPENWVNDAHLLGDALANIISAVEELLVDGEEVTGLSISVIKESFENEKYKDYIVLFKEVAIDLNKNEYIIESATVTDANVGNKTAIIKIKLTRKLFVNILCKKLRRKSAGVFFVFIHIQESLKYVVFRLQGILPKPV